MKKRLLLCILLAGIIALLAGCQGGGETAPTLPPINEYGDNPSTGDDPVPEPDPNTDPDSVSAVTATPAQADTRLQKADGELTDGTKYIVYIDDTLALSGKDVTVRLSGESKLSEHLNKYQSD